MIQHSPLYHQHTCGVKPIGGRTVILKARPETMAGSLHLPEAWQGAQQADWEATVVDVAEQGGWRMGMLHRNKEEQYGHLAERPVQEIPEKLRRDPKIWQIPPYFVEKPKLPPGTKILCCHLSGQPVRSVNGYDYYLTDGEHAYKAVVV